MDAEGSRDGYHGVRQGFCIHLLCDHKQVLCQPRVLFLQFLSEMNGACSPVAGAGNGGGVMCRHGGHGGIKGSGNNKRAAGVPKPQF